MDQSRRGTRTGPRGWEEQCLVALLPGDAQSQLKFLRGRAEWVVFRPWVLRQLPAAPERRSPRARFSPEEHPTGFGGVVGWLPVGVQDEHGEDNYYAWLSARQLIMFSIAITMTGWPPSE